MLRTVRAAVAASMLATAVLLARAAGRVLPADHNAAMLVGWLGDAMPALRRALRPLAGRRLPRPICPDWP